MSLYHPCSVFTSASILRSKKKKKIPSHPQHQMTGFTFTQILCLGYFLILTSALVVGDMSGLTT